MDHAFAHDDDGAVRSLAVFEGPSCDQQDAQRAEEPRRDGVNVRARHVACVRARLSFGAVEHGGCVAVERDIAAERGCAHAWHRPRTLQQRSTARAVYSAPAEAIVHC
jgi:hypothetical protein